MTESDFSRRVEAATDKLFRVAYAILRNEADCADALQEALCRAWMNLPRLREESLFDTWLTRILINESYALARKRNRRASLPAQPAAPPAPHNDLREALMALPGDERLCVTLYYAEGYRVQEIAGMLKIPAGTVKGRLYRARERLRKMLESEADER